MIKMPCCIPPFRQKCLRFSRICSAAAFAALLQMPSNTVAQNAGAVVTPVATTPAQQPQVQQAGTGSKPAVAEKNGIVKIAAQRAEKNLEITILCSKQPDHTAYELPGSDRKGIVIDIANGELQKSADTSSLAVFKVTLGGINKPDAELSRLRLEFHLPEPYASYTASLKDNSVVLLIENFFKDGYAVPAADVAPLSVPATAAPPIGKEEGKKNMPETVPGGKSIDLPAVNPAIKSPSSMEVSGPTAGADIAGASPLGGMNSKPITVDFYKVDLHNVFRLLGEISGYNIIVADGVSGTLTLALHEVPWDFVLDIILNLKELAKEQDFKTIVIYPKNKGFVWPKRAATETTLKMEPEGKKRSIVIAHDGEDQAQSPEVMEAKKLLTLGIKAEKEDSLETAMLLYEKALDMWPDKVEKKEKSKLANKIASIYLARLNQNAKAVYYAQKALNADKKNNSAALNAAIGHANMEEASQAQQYFDQSISTGTPSREALFSYAVFSERQKQYEAALKLLNKYSELYGEDLDSMVSRARILDQQGRKEEAGKAYTAILHAGFSVPQDLRAYIMSRARSN